MMVAGMLARLRRIEGRKVSAGLDPLIVAWTDEGAEPDTLAVFDEVPGEPRHYRRQPGETLAEFTARAGCPHFAQREPPIVLRMGLL